MFNKHLYPAFDKHLVKQTPGCDVANFEENYQAWKKALRNCNQKPADQSQPRRQDKRAELKTTGTNEELKNTPPIKNEAQVKDVQPAATAVAKVSDAAASVQLDEEVSCQPDGELRAALNSAINDSVEGHILKASPRNERKPEAEAGAKEDKFYLLPREVIVLYGPYFYLGVLDYRQERLHGLQAALKFAGANPKLQEYNRIDHVSIWYLDLEIFQCRLTDLHHGGDGELDELCFEAAKAFKNHSEKALMHIKKRYKFNVEEVLSKDSQRKGNKSMLDKLKLVCPPEESDDVTPAKSSGTDNDEVIEGGTKHSRKCLLPRIRLPGRKRITFSVADSAKSRYETESTQEMNDE